MKNLLLLQCCCRPHWAHLFGASPPHWQPPGFAQQAQSLLLELNWHSHPFDSFVHMSIWSNNKEKPLTGMRKSERIAKLNYTQITVFLRRHFFIGNKSCTWLSQYLLLAQICFCRLTSTWPIIPLHFCLCYLVFVFPSEELVKSL